MTAVPDTTTGLCVDCNYPLRGLTSELCPECGRSFDPADPSSMNMGEPLGPIGRGILGPTRGIAPIAIVLIVPIVVRGAWNPDRTALILIAMLYVAVGFPAWIICRVRHWVVHRYRQPAAFVYVDAKSHRRARIAF